MNATPKSSCAPKRTAGLDCTGPLAFLKRIQRIRNLLGPAVLIPIRPLTKKPAKKGWQQLTLDIMRDPRHLAALARGNIGVVLGRASSGLCTIDLDSEAAVEPFLKANPRLRGTTRTKRIRGCNIWVRIDGEYPRNTELKTAAGKHVGEWRADGNQTIIYGSAIDRAKGETKPTSYVFLNEVKPIQIRFNDIVFPKCCFFKTTHPPPIRLNAESASFISTSLHPTSLHNIRACEILENILAKTEAHKVLAAKNPALARLYRKLVEPRFLAQAHERNRFITEAVPFLFHAVAAPLVLKLVGHFYDCNRLLFHDSRKQHLKEAAEMLRSVSTSYAAKLDEVERKIYAALRAEEQDAFRICRDLALLPEPPRMPFTFFLSFEHLADRIGVYPMQAQRIMRQLASYGLLRQLKKGTRRERGVPGVAGNYQWLLNDTLVL